MPNITVEQIRDYTALAREYFRLSSMSGSSWRPEYAVKLEELKKRLAEMKKKMFGGEKDAKSKN